MGQADATASNTERDEWWGRDMGDPDVASLLTAYVVRLLRQDQGRLMRSHGYLDLYEGRIGPTDGTASDGQLYVEERFGLDRGMLMASRSAVETTHSRIVGEVPTVRAKGVGSDGSQHLRAMRLSRFLTGVLGSLRWDDVVASALVMSALKVGTGIVRTRVGPTGRISIESVPVTEVFVDRGESRYGTPSRFYHLKAVDRSVAMGLYGSDPTNVEAIREAPPPYDWVARRLPVGHDYDLIDVLEAWDMDTHRHVACINDAVVCDMPYAHESPPLVFLHFSPPEVGRGFWGQGLIEVLDPLQYEIDEILRDVGTAIRMGSRYKIFADSTDRELNEDALLDPGFGSLVYGQKPPQFLAPNPVATETINHLQWLIQQLYAMAGTTESAVSGQKPAGIQSGVALLHYHEFATKRYVDFVKRLGTATCDVAYSLIDRAADMEDCDSWTARYAKGSVIRELRYSDVAMDRSDFVISLQEVSPIPDSFSGREQLIAQMQADGTLPQGYLQRMVEDPDVVRANIIASADADLAESVIERLLDQEAGDPPLDDNMNVDLVTDVVRASLMSSIANGLDDMTLDRHRDYLHALKDLKDSLSAPPVPQLSPSPTVPGGPGMPQMPVGPANVGPMPAANAPLAMPGA